MEFPSLVYRSPGPHHGPNGKTFEYAPVENDDDVERMKKEGWHEDLQVACGVKKPEEPEEPEDPEDPIDEDSPPSREELKEMADSLGLTYARNSTNEKLQKLIDDKLAEE